MLAVVVNANLAAAAAGGAALAAYAVCARLQVFAGMTQVGISQGLQPIAGYNFGARKFDRVARVYRSNLPGYEDCIFVKVGKALHYIDTEYQVVNKLTGEAHPTACWLVDVLKG